MLRSFSSSVADTTTETVESTVDAAVDGTAAQLADSDTLRGEEDVDAMQEQLHEASDQMEVRPPQLSQHAKRAEEHG